MPSKEQEEQLPANPNKPPVIHDLDHNAPLEKSHNKSDAVGDLKSPTTPQTKVRESRMIEKSRIVLLASLAFVAFLVFVYTTRGKTPDLQNPANWKPHELKEWLAEHRIHYEGIPEKQDLIKLVKENWAQVQDKTPGDAAQDFIAKCMMIIKNRYGKAEEIAEDKVENFTQDAAEIIEQLRLNSGLTEEQVAATFDKIMAELTSTKIKTSETINRALEQIHESYNDALKQRDSLLKDAVERIQNDIKSSKEISQDTVDWFKEQVKKMSESTGFAKARTQTQVTMILQSIQEQLTAKKITAPQNANVIYERLNSSVKEYYQDIESRLERVRQDLMKSIGDQADFIVDDLKSGFQGYQQLTQERIHEILEQIYAKLKEGKDFTIDQIQEIGNIVNWYFFHPMHSATEEVKKATSKVQDAGQNQFAYITDAIEKTLAKARTVPQEKFQFRETIMQNIFSAQHLTQEQSRILSQTIQDQLKDVNDASELTKEKVVMFVEALKKRLSEYEDVSQKANTKNEL